MALSDTRIRALKAKPERYEVADGAGLFILLTVPFFIWAGLIMERGGISLRLVRLSSRPPTLSSSALMWRDTEAGESPC